MTTTPTKMTVKTQRRSLSLSMRDGSRTLTYQLVSMQRSGACKTCASRRRRMVLKEAPLPEDITKLGVEGVNRIWRDAKLRGAGMKRAKTLVTAAEQSVGSTEAPEAARMELKNLLADMDEYTARQEELLRNIVEKLKKIPYIDNLLSIKGIGMVTVSGFIAEVGDIGRFDNPKQLQKLAGYVIVADDSGKHNGESRISYRGRKRLRYVLYETAISLMGKNAEFREIHEYYRTRKENPLKKMQSVVAVAGGNIFHRA